jgi:hypothetical protein
MTRLLVCIVSVLCITFGGSNVFAQISAMQVVEDSSIGMYSQVQLANGKSFFVVPRVVGKENQIETYSINSEKPLFRVNIPYLPIFMLQTQATDLIVGADAGGVWHVDRLTDKMIIQRGIVLGDMSVVRSTLKTKDGYVLAGSSLSDKPLLVQLDKNLKEIRRVMFSSSKSGELDIFSTTTNGSIGIINHEDGTSLLVWFDFNFDIKESLELAGGAATGLYGSKKILVAYTSKNNSIVIEAFDELKKSMWRRIVFERTGTSTLKFRLYPTRDGYGLVGANRSTLTVAGIAEDGSIFDILFDRSSLAPPIGDSYSVIVNGSNFHIFGAGYKKGLTASTSPFRFHMLSRVGG